MALSENYRTETIGRSDCRPIVRLSADTIVRWDYRPNPSSAVHQRTPTTPSDDAVSAVHRCSASLCAVTRTETAKRAFRVAAPNVWNGIRNASWLSTFHAKLNTLLLHTRDEHTHLRFSVLTFS